MSSKIVLYSKIVWAVNEKKIGQKKIKCQVRLSLWQPYTYQIIKNHKAEIEM